MKRVCPLCKKTFRCKGECKNKERIGNYQLCYCGECYKDKIYPILTGNFFASDLFRENCPAIPREIKDKIYVELLVAKLEGRI